MKDVIVKSEYSIRLLNDGSFLDIYAMPKDNTPFDMRDIIKKRNSKKDWNSISIFSKLHFS